MSSHAHLSELASYETDLLRTNSKGVMVKVALESASFAVKSALEDPP